MKVCLIGNSHLAAIKRAWDRRDPRGDVECTFFGSPARTLEALCLRDRALTSEDERVRRAFRLTAGTDRIELDAFDAFVLVSLVFSFRQLLWILGSHVLYQHSGMRPGQAILSDAAFEQCVQDVNAASPGSRIAQVLTACTGKTPICVASPCPAESILRLRGFGKFARSVDDPLLPALYARYVAVADRLADAGGWTFLPQEKSTLRVPGLTLERFSVDSGRIGWTAQTEGPRKRADAWHMNAYYGDVVVERLLERLLDRPRDVGSTLESVGRG